MHSVTQTEKSAEAGEIIKCSVKPSKKIYASDILDTKFSRKMVEAYAKKHNILERTSISAEDVAGDSKALMAKSVRDSMETVQVDTFPLIGRKRN